MLSIPSYKSNDPNYRYKMPRLVAKVEGRGNGIKTNIVNMGEIARALKRPPEYATRFCGHELGTSAKFEGNEGKAIVNGAHEQRDLQALIDKFIDKFVLCQNCFLPEIDLVVRSDKVGYSCNACGNQGVVDNAHKLATFILRNPPEGGDTTCGLSKKLTKEERQKLKLQKKREEEEEEEAARKRRSKKKKDKDRKEKEEDPEENAEDPDAAAAAAAAAKKQRKKKKKRESESGGAPVQGLTFASPEVDSMVRLMLDYLGGPPASGGNDFYAELNLVRITNGASQSVTFYVALCSLFHESLGVAFDPAGVQQRAARLATVARSMKAKDVLSAFETFAANRQALKQYPYLLQKLYDEDIVSEKALIRYYSKDASEGGSQPEIFAAARTAAKPFIDWLENDDGSSSSGGDDDDDEEDNAEAAERQRLGGAKMKSLPTVNKSSLPTTSASLPVQQDQQHEEDEEDEDDDDDEEDDEEEEESDVDIDAI